MKKLAFVLMTIVVFAFSGVNVYAQEYTLDELDIKETELKKQITYNFMQDKINEAKAKSQEQSKHDTPEL